MIVEKMPEGAWWQRKYHERDQVNERTYPVLLPGIPRSLTSGARSVSRGRSGEVIDP
jgi:hypothetical protein